MTTFQNKAGVTTFQALTLRSALSLYAKAKVQVNRLYTPSAMLRTATHITGHAYKRGQYEQAIKDLTCWIEANGTAG